MSRPSERVPMILSWAAGPDTPSKETGVVERYARYLRSHDGHEHTRVVRDARTSPAALDAQFPRPAAVWAGRPAGGRGTVVVPDLREPSAPDVFTALIETQQPAPLEPHGRTVTLLGG
jgi:hypothetical protein